MELPPKCRHDCADGCSILDFQVFLLRQCLEPWLRRGRTMLEINGNSVGLAPFLETFGLEVTGLELKDLGAPPPPAKDGASAGVTHRADPPFENSSFDWVLLHLLDADSPAMERSLRKAARVATHGMAVTFWNTASLPFLLRRPQWLREEAKGAACRWWRVWRELMAMGGGLSCHSTLALPLHFSGRRKPRAGICNRAPFGAWIVLRIDMPLPRTVTPLPLRIASGGMRDAAPAMQFGSKARIRARQ